MVYFIIIIICISAYLDFKKYNNSNYKKETGYKYTKVRFNLGFYGEYATYNVLDRIEGNKKILTNVYIPKANGGTTEIDLIMIHEKGIFVIESKNYSGWIFGSEDHRYWTQTLKNGQKNKFYNPIMQNQSHIKHLMNLLKCNMDYFIKSIIVFSERCQLKKIEVHTTGIRVINRQTLEKTIYELIDDSVVSFSEIDINEWYSKLKIYSNASEDIKFQHIKNVSRYKN